MRSRTSNALLNSIVSAGGYFLGIITSFVCRTVFTVMLGQEYLGVSGLFTNILTILSFAELGIGTAIGYRLYAPLHNNDKEKILQYMLLYKKIYSIIAVTVFVVGISVMPFLQYIVDAPAVHEDVRILYILYLINTTVSYILTYKKSLLIADQKDYIVTLITQIIMVLMNASQCILLLLTHDFILYLIAQIVFTLLTNIICSLYADKLYPFLKEKPSERLEKSEVSGLKKDVSGLLLTKVAATAFSGTDNLFISAYVGIGSVGILSNYTLLLTAINGVMNKVFGSLTATIGNLAVSDDKGHTEIVLKRLYFLNAAIYSFICTGVLLLIEEFVTQIWLNNDYILPQAVVSLAIIELFFRSVHYPLHTTQLAMGLFSQYKFVYLIAAGLNILLDFILVKPYGIAGLFIATIICRAIIYITDICVVYYVGFKKSPWRYLINIVKWVVFIIACVIVSGFCLKLIANSVIVWFVMKMLLVTIIYALLFLCVFHRTKEFAYFMGLLKSAKNRKRG